MKTMRKLVTGLLTICILFIGSSTVALAAGSISFTDIDNASVGANFSVKGVIDGGGESLGQIDVVLSFDPAAIRFVSGDNVTLQGDNQLAFSTTGSGDRTEFMMEFQALAEGETRINQDSATVASSSGSTLDLAEGYSDITVGPGDASLIEAVPAPNTEGGTPVTVDGQDYTLSSSFSDADIPPYFTNTEITFEGNQYKGVILENGTLSLGYLINNQSNEGRFFVFNDADSTFTPFEQIQISEVRSIVLLQDDGTVNLPSHFEQVTLTINDRVFPAWQDVQREGFYIIYAVNNEGVKGFYLYDSEEMTYQRFDVNYEAVVNPSMEEPVDDSTFFGKIASFLKTNFNYTLIGAGFLLLMLLVILLIVGVKLHNRNVEIDDLYDEFGIDDEPARGGSTKSASNKPSSNRRQSKYDDYDDDDDEFEEYDDDDDEFEEYDDDEYDDEYDDDEYDDDEYDDDEYDDDEYDDDEFEEYDDDEDDYIEPVQAPRKATPPASKKRKARGASKGDDFSMDFIDLK